MFVLQLHSISCLPTMSILFCATYCALSRYDKRYVLYLFLMQMVNAVTPVAAALLPRMVIDELTGLGRVNC